MTAARLSIMEPELSTRMPIETGRSRCWYEAIVCCTPSSHTRKSPCRKSITRCPFSSTAVQFSRTSFTFSSRVYKPPCPFWISPERAAVAGPCCGGGWVTSTLSWGIGRHDGIAVHTETGLCLRLCRIMAGERTRLRLQGGRGGLRERRAAAQKNRERKNAGS